MTGGASAGESRLRIAGACAVVGLGALLVSLPHVLAFVTLSPDAVEYVSIAHNWVEGRGFVNAVLFSYYLDGVSPPFPSLAARAPVLSVLLAAGLGAGLGLVGLGVAHVVWASLIGASSTLVARRLMSLPSAAALGVLLSWSPAWELASTRLLTEASGVGALLMLIASAPLALRSTRGALLASALAGLAWLTRPNLGAFVPLLLVAAVLDLGPRAALRSRPLWVYVASFLLLHRALILGSEAAFGIAPYANYGIMLQTLSMDEVAGYQTAYPGALGFVGGHLAELLAINGRNLLRLVELAFHPMHLFVGVIAVPGIVHGLLARGPDRFGHRLVSVAALGFSGVAALTSWGFDDRYALPGFVCAWLAGMAFLDRVVVRLAGRRSGSDRRTALLRLAPVALASALVTVQVAPDAARRLGFVLDRSYSTRLFLPLPEWNLPNRAFCGRLDPDALVASPAPWNLVYWCGNAGLLLPPDLDDAALLDRYLDERSPGYLITDDERTTALFRSSPRLEVAASHGKAFLFRVAAPDPRSRPWRSPGPLAELGPPLRAGSSSR